MYMYICSINKGGIINEVKIHNYQESFKINMIIGTLDIFSLIVQSHTDKIISQCDVKHIMTTNKNKNIRFGGLHIHHD